MMPPKNIIATTLMPVAFVVSCNCASAQDKRVFYESRYTLVGFLVRAANVCGGNKRDFEVAFSLVAPDEMKAFSTAFPKTTAEWMQRGAENFNTGVMKDGIPANCTYALEVLKKAQGIAHSDNAR